MPVSAGSGSAHASLAKIGKQEVEHDGVRGQGARMSPTWKMHEN